MDKRVFVKYTALLQQEAGGYGFPTDGEVGGVARMEVAGHRGTLHLSIQRIKPQRDGYWCALVTGGDTPQLRMPEALPDVDRGRLTARIDITDARDVVGAVLLHVTPDSDIVVGSAIWQGEAWPWRQRMPGLLADMQTRQHRIPRQSIQEPIQETETIAPEQTAPEATPEAAQLIADSTPVPLPRPTVEPAPEPHEQVQPVFAPAPAPDLGTTPTEPPATNMPAPDTAVPAMAQASETPAQENTNAHTGGMIVDTYESALVPPMTPESVGYSSAPQGGDWQEADSSFLNLYAEEEPREPLVMPYDNGVYQSEPDAANEMPIDTQNADAAQVAQAADAAQVSDPWRVPHADPSGVPERQDLLQLHALFHEELPTRESPIVENEGFEWLCLSLEGNEPFADYIKEGLGENETPCFWLGRKRTEEGVRLLYALPAHEEQPPPPVGVQEHLAWRPGVHAVGRPRPGFWLLCFDGNTGRVLHCPV